MQSEEVELLKKKAEIFRELKLPCHLGLISGKFLNGQIRKVNDSFLLIEDIKLLQVPVFFDEIFTLEKYAFRGYGEQSEVATE